MKTNEEKASEWVDSVDLLNEAGKNIAYIGYLKALEYSDQFIIEKDKELAELQKNLNDCESKYRVCKKDLLFKDACELPCKDAEYELLKSKADKLAEAMMEIIREYSDQSVQLRTPIAYFKPFHKGVEALQNYKGE